MCTRAWIFTRKSWNALIWCLSYKSFLLQIVGVSCIDTVKMSISVAEFQDDDSFMYLEAIVVSLKPKECILQLGESNPDFQAVKQVR